MEKLNVKIGLLVIIVLLYGCINNRNEKDVSIVPSPKNILLSTKAILFELSEMGVEADSVLIPLRNIVAEDLYRLSGVKIKDNKAPHIQLTLSSFLDEDAYTVQIKEKEIKITGGSYHAVVMGWNSVLQVAEIKDSGLSVPVMDITDHPDLEYRGLMLDLARQFHTHHVVKQMIDICRWYKIRHLHLHLSDEGRIVFPTKIFPEMLEERYYYTEEELREIVTYANDRGVLLVPELEGPGHSRVLRAGYPELFGEVAYDVIDLSKDKALESMKTLIEEIMESFPYSPYFHIGADEINLNILKTVPHVKERMKEAGYTDIHDLYLNYLVELNRFIRSKGKQTFVWEGFDKDGSDCVKVPKDIQVFVFETLFQRPDSLVKNGYHIINTTWKPLYITQTRRWSPEKIYHWNYYIWENFWEITPAAKAPVILDQDERTKITGAQMCAWEMTEEMEYPALCKRLAAFSERVWNTTGTHDYKQFEDRMLKSEAKLRRLIYPIVISAGGLTETDYQGVYYNRENYFSGELTLSVKTCLPNTILHYTLDGRFPSLQTPVLPEKLVLDKTSFLKIALYDREDGKLLTYYPVLFENRPLKVEFAGENYNDNNPDRCITFADSVYVRIEQIPAKGSVYYTLDGSAPSVHASLYQTEIPVSSPCGLRFQYFDEEGQAKGEPYGYFLCPQNEWYELLRFDYRW